MNKDGTRNLRELRKELRVTDPQFSDQEVLRLWIDGHFPMRLITGRPKKLVLDQIRRSNCLSELYETRVKPELTKEEKLQLLRDEWVGATQERRKEIRREAAIINGEIKTYQCYYIENGTRCEKQQEEYWCSIEHESLWKEENYQHKQERHKRRLTKEELIEGMRRIQERAKLKTPI